MKALQEALKEGLRIVVLAIIPIAIEGLSQGVFNTKLILITAIIAALRFADSWLHQSNKEKPKSEQNDGMLGERGLTGF